MLTEKYLVYLTKGLGQIPVPPIPNSACAMRKLSQTRVCICKKVPCQMRHYYLQTCEIYLVVRHFLSGYICSKWRKV